MRTALLRQCSIAYLLLPNLLFSLGWFRQPYAILLISGFLYLFFIECTKKDSNEKLSLKDILFVLSLAFLWTFFCGIHGLSSQSMDWLAHQAKFYDLYKNDWPLYFEDVNRYACYYFGYYLFPSLISKWSGELLPMVWIAWTCFGFFLGLAWIYTLINKNKLLLIVFLFVRGAGQLIVFIFNKLGAGHIDLPIYNPSVRSVFEQSVYAPNQVIPAVIVCGILVHDLVSRKKEEESFFIVTLAFIWGIFPAMVLVLLYTAVLVNKYFVGENLEQLTFKSMVRCYILPGTLFVPTFIYFLSAQSISTQGFLWSFGTIQLTAIGYFTGFMIDLLMFYIVVYWLNKNYLPVWFINVIFGGLFLLTQYRLGIYSDLYFRGSTPLCIILSVCILKGLDMNIQTGQWGQPRYFFIALSLMVCLCLNGLWVKTPLLRDNILVNYGLGKRDSYKAYAYDKYPNTYQALRFGYKDEEGAKQYLGSGESFYKKYLSENNKAFFLR